MDMLEVSSQLAEQKRIKSQTMFYMEFFSKALKIKANA